MTKVGKSVLFALATLAFVGCISSSSIAREEDTNKSGIVFEGAGGK